MSAFEIFSDSSCNLPDEIIKKRNINIVSLVFIADGKEYISYEKAKESNLQQFYALLRDRKEITTSCVNEETFYQAFRAAAQEGKDILYIGFSSALSATFANGKSALQKLKKEFPQRKLLFVDTLGASIGEGLIVLHGADKRDQGLSIEETAAAVEQAKLHMCHWFTVGDLFYLYRGGRVKRVAYYVANLINIKPVMHMDDEGRLIPVSNVMGRRKSLLALVDKAVATIVNPEEQTIAVSHGDCIEDVEFLLSKLREKITIKDVIVNYVDPVVGSHSGPGTVALFFFGTHR